MDWSDRGIVIGPVQLDLKTGGKSGAFIGGSGSAASPSEDE